MRHGSLALIFTVLAAGFVDAQPRLEDVELGFNGKFFRGALTPIVVSLSHNGPSQVFTLEISQDIQEFNESSSVERLQVPVSLGLQTRKSISFDFLIQSISTPLQIKLFSGTQEITRTAIDLRSRWSEAPFSLGLNVSGLQSVEHIEPEKLPKRWTSYESVRRIYWGRFDPERLSPEQRTALYGWLLRGGDLVVLAGSNWYEQVGAWWAKLMPITDGRVVQRDGSPAAWLEGKLRPGARVVQELEGRPLIWERSVGLGRVILIAVDTLLPQLPPAPPARAGESAQAIDRALRALIVPFPSREIVGILLVLFIMGVGLSGLWRNATRWVVLSALLLSVVLVGYWHSPRFSYTSYALEFGILWGWSGMPMAWEQSLYGVFSRWSSENVFQAECDSVRVIKPSYRWVHTDVLIEIAQKRSLRAHSPRNSVRGFQCERMIEPPFDFMVDRSVSPPRVRVYNKSTVPVQDAVVQIGEKFYRLGEIRAQAELVYSLDELDLLSKGAWLSSLAPERRWLWQEWGDSSESSKLIGWPEGRSLWTARRGEQRTVVWLMIIEAMEDAIR